MKLTENQQIMLDAIKDLDNHFCQWCQNPAEKEFQCLPTNNVRNMEALLAYTVNLGFRQQGQAVRALIKKGVLKNLLPYNPIDWRALVVQF